MSETKAASAERVGDLRARLRGSMTREYASWERSQTREVSETSFRTSSEPAATGSQSQEQSSVEVTHVSALV